MRYYLTLLILTTLFRVTAQDDPIKPFEGTFTISTSSDDGIQADFTIKEKMLMMTTETEKGPITQISNQKTGDKTILQTKEDKKLAIIKNDKTSPKKSREIPKAAPKAGAEMDLKLTKETKKLQGFNCTKVTFKNDQHEAVGWVTNDFDLDYRKAFKILKKQKGPTYPFENAFAKEGFLILLNVKELATEQEHEFKITAKRQKVDPVVFEIPEEYKVTDLTNPQQLIMDAKGDAEKLKSIRKAMKASRGQ